ncbi:MAG: LPS export ABC transporter periplasmic protein LptC [Ignavibacteria bacterium]|nr:LPS export ABC transporter periplasmic protein LptC [Ignavibacteria bacterium]
MKKLFQPARVFGMLFTGITYFACLAGSTGCQPEKVQPQVAQIGKQQEIPAQESWKSTIVFTDSGKTKAVMNAGHLQSFTQRQETMLDSSVQVDFYGRSQKIVTVLTSRKGKVDDRTKNLYAYENVVVKNDSGVVLNSEELMWDNQNAKIVTDKFVTITTPTERIQGYGFNSDQYLRNYVIYRITYITSAKSLHE